MFKQIKNFINGDGDGDGGGGGIRFTLIKTCIKY